MPRRTSQLKLFAKPRKLPGRDRGGRPPKGWNPRSGEPRPPKGVSHLRREAVSARHPVNITLRVKPHVWNLRTKRAWEVVSWAVAASQNGVQFRIAMFVVMGNHLHLICEAADRGALSKGVQALEIRIAMRLNRLMGTKGAVFADRYYAHVLRSASEVARAVAYLVNQYRHHFQPVGAALARVNSSRWKDPFFRSGLEPGDVAEGLVVPPRTTLLARTWRFVRLPEQRSR
jgi:putative transposase